MAEVSATRDELLRTATAQSQSPECRRFA